MSQGPFRRSLATHYESMKPTVFAVLLLMVLPMGTMAIMIPNSTDWTDFLLDTHTSNVVADSGPNAMGIAAYDGVDNDVDVFIGTPGAFTKTSFAARTIGCIGNLGSTSWGIILYDPATDTAKWRKTPDNGATWGSEIEVLGVADLTGILCSVDFFASGNYRVTIVYKDQLDVYSVRSTDFGASWINSVLIDSNLHSALTFTATNGMVFYRDMSTLQVRRTSDEGVTFATETQVTSPAPLMGAATTPSGTTVLFKDTGAGSVLAYWSSDGGTTWASSGVVYSSGATLEYSGNVAQVAGETVYLVFGIATTNALVISGSEDQGITFQSETFRTGSNWRGPAFGIHSGKMVVVAGDNTNGGTDGFWTSQFSDGGTGAPGGEAGIEGTSRVFNGNLTPTHTLTVDGLTGFDVGPDGSKVITRQNAPSTGYMVRTYSGNNLATLGTFTEPDFMFYGVVASNNNVAFVDKTSTDNDGILIKSADMSAPLRPTGCNSDTCPDHIENLDETGNFPDLQDIGEFAGVNVDYNKFVDCGVLEDWNIIGMSFSTSAGNVGLWAKFTGNNIDDEGELKTLATAFAGSGTLPTQVTSWETNLSPGYSSTFDRHYVAAVDPAGGAKVWSNRIDERASCLISGAGADDVGIETHGAVFLAPGNYPDPLAIAGRGQIVVVATDDLIGAFNMGTGQKLWEFSDTGIKPRSVATQPYVHNTAPMGSSQVVAYANATQIKVLDLLTGGAVAKGPAPTGSWVGTELDAVGGVLFAATSTNVTRYDVHLSTCVDSCNPTNPDGTGGVGGTGTGGTGGTGTGGTGGGTIDPSLLKRTPVFFGFLPLLEVLSNGEVSTEQWGYLAGIALTAALAAAPAGNKRTRNTIVSVIMAFVGTTASYFLGYFHLAVPVLSAVLAAAVVIFQRR